MAPNSSGYVTEIVVKLSPLDVILPLAILEKFLAVVKPFINFYRSPRQRIISPAESNRIDSEIPIAFLPLVYFDIPMLRIFVPISTASRDSPIVASSDTLVCEVRSVIFSLSDSAFAYKFS